MPTFKYQKQSGLLQSNGTSGKWEVDMWPQHSVSGSNTDFGTAATGAIDKPGVYVTSRGGVCAMTLPDPAEYPGGIFHVRSTTAQAHTISVEQDTTKIHVWGVKGQNQASVSGTTLTLAAAVNNGATLMSDGANWLLLAHRGAVTGLS